MVVACLLSAAAQDTGSIQEKRLRADYCLGFFLAQKNYIPKVCANLDSKLPAPLRIQNCQQTVAQQNITILQRLTMYLSSTGGMGDTASAMVQGKLDTDQCFRMLDDPQYLNCELACVQKRAAPQTPAEALRTGEETFRYCRYACHPICAKAF